MSINQESLTIRINRLKQLITEYPINEDEPDYRVNEILRTAPQALLESERAVRSDDPLILKDANDEITESETFLEWAVKTIEAKNLAENKSESSDQTQLLADQRLLKKTTSFLEVITNTEPYMSYIKEFAQEITSQDNIVNMEHIFAYEAFLQWLLYDFKFPAESKRLIDLFSKENLNRLAYDEQELLKLRLQDRPSIFTVLKFKNVNELYNLPGIYLVQDLLSPADNIKIWDEKTSKTLQIGTIFIGRIFPIDSRANIFNLLAPITELPEQLWNILSVFLNKWSKEYFSNFPNATTKDFFRNYHVKLRRKILKATGMLKK